MARIIWFAGDLSIHSVSVDFLHGVPVVLNDINVFKTEETSVQQFDFGFSLAFSDIANRNALAFDGQMIFMEITNDVIHISP